MDLNPQPKTVKVNIFNPDGPTNLELAKALRECFLATQGRIPTAPLDQLIAQYDMFYNLNPANNKQLEADK